MKLNKNKGRWFSNTDRESKIIDPPSLLDDVAYHFYCKDRESNVCVPQITFMWNVKRFNQTEMFKYYNKAKKLLKIEKLINKCNEN